MLIVVLGLCALMTVEVVRRLPGIEARVLAGKRPWACHACMSVWAALFWGGAICGYRWPLPGPEIYETIAAAGLCYLLLRFLDTKPPPLP